MWKETIIRGADFIEVSWKKGKVENVIKFSPVTDEELLLKRARSKLREMAITRPGMGIQEEMKLVEKVQFVPA